MATKWCTKLEVAQKRCLVFFLDHPSNFKVTRAEKLMILSRIEHVPTVTPVWIHRWVRNYAQSFKGGIEEVLYGFLRSSVKFQGHTFQKMADLVLIWAFLDDNSWFEFIDGYQMTQVAFRNMEEVLYCFTRSSVKIQGQTGRKIGDFIDLDMIWARLHCGWE